MKSVLGLAMALVEYLKRLDHISISATLSKALGIHNMKYDDSTVAMPSLRKMVPRSVFT